MPFLNCAGASLRVTVNITFDYRSFKMSVIRNDLNETNCDEPWTRDISNVYTKRIASLTRQNSAFNNLYPSRLLILLSLYILDILAHLYPVISFGISIILYHSLNKSRNVFLYYRMEVFISKCIYNLRNRRCVTIILFFTLAEAANIFFIITSSLLVRS